MNKKMRRFFTVLSAIGGIILFSCAGLSDSAKISLPSAAALAALSCFLLLSGLWGLEKCRKNDLTTKKRPAPRPSAPVIPFRRSA